MKAERAQAQPTVIAAPAARPAILHGRALQTRLVLDGLSVAAALGLSFLVRFRLGLLEVTEASPLTVRAHAFASVLWLLGVIGALAVNRLYDQDTLFSGGGEYSRVLRSVVEAMALLSVFVFLTQSFYVSRSWFAMTVMLSLGLIIGQRSLVRSYLHRQHAAGRSRRPAVLVSRSDEEWTDWPFEQAHEFEVVERLDPAEFESFAEGLDREDFRDLAIVLRARDFTHDEFWRILLVAGHQGWSVFVHSPVRSVGRDRLTVRELAGQTIVKVAPPVLTGVRALQKRILDVALSTALMVVSAPVLAAIALAVLVSSGRPVFYRQERMGRDGRMFDMLKFRTMKINAEDHTGPVWTSAHDDRRTTIGRLLRRTSLDELPQLWNVLMGHMSLVGPRPERQAFIDRFEQELTWYRFRHRMRPGITGWAQSHGLRGNTSLESRVQFDNWYIENWSIALDLKILVRTIREMFRGDNAY